MNEDHYPTDDELEIIKTWDFNKKPMTEFLEYIKNLWHWEDWGFKLTGKRVLKLELHTGGWSGNESIIIALEKNWIFWMMCWEKSVRGGHYWFKIPLKTFRSVR